MNPATDVTEQLPEIVAPGGVEASPRPAISPRSRRSAGLAVATRGVGLAVVVYLGVLALLFAVALINGALRHHSLTGQLGNWDGRWYSWIAADGYPTHVTHLQTRLGFLPFYPLCMWVVAEIFGCSVTVAGIILSAVGGCITAVLVQRLATGWWGEASGRRAVVLFCLCPGAVVFSMVYSEGLLLALSAGCILALERRRWLLAGALAAVATAIEPDALALVAVCAVSAFLELRRRGFGARSSILAPLLAPVGAAACAAFLWAWTGTPLATYETQHYGWHEKTDPLALVHMGQRLASEISFTHFNHPTINLNYVVGLLGALVLIAGLALLLRHPRQISPEGLTWTLATSFLAMTSEFVPPNPRLLITAFPAVLVFAHRLRGRKYVALLVVNCILLVGLSALTYVGVTLRP